MANLADLMQSFFSKGVAAANILAGNASVSAGTAPTTLITIPAGRTWVGKLAASVSTAISAAGTSNGVCDAVFSTAGAGVTPAAGNIFGVRCRAGANAVGGTVGSQGSNTGVIDGVVIVAPAGNAVQLQYTTAMTGVCIADVSAIGQLI